MWKRAFKKTMSHAMSLPPPPRSVLDLLKPSSLLPPSGSHEIRAIRAYGGTSVSSKRPRISSPKSESKKPILEPAVPLVPIQDGWLVETHSLGRSLRERYGPYLVVSARSVNPKSTRHPLVYLGAILEAVSASRPMASKLSTSPQALSYVEWVSDRLESRLTPKQVETAKAVSVKHGLDRPFYLSAGTQDGHAWASNAAWIDEFVGANENKDDAKTGAAVVPFVFSAMPLPVLTTVGSTTTPGKRASRTKKTALKSTQSVAIEPTQDEEDEGYQSASERFGGDGETPAHSSKKRKRKSLPSAVRMAVWNRWFGMEKGTGDCQCCGRVVYQQDFECGHVVAHSKGGADTIDNLRPICRTCNRSMGDRDFDEFREAYWSDL